ncbi:MAG: flagellar basal body P-ring protein FlgI [Alphaproteobacteria bacterium]|nr:flagellar basal body P-ring protein FlgI [Alphaproteobacteria bacterium]MDE2014253.1 flagellar basal body P-ring protein FlgI [Alphaproteobacteria bacterium]MDE2074226.1 flagellar basal body P-ring protein FlgI [Alphaproteobacteria bacterium]MDE2352242.1 flagellar basal body P-ring protein FlgI [Alphaproteobacteria bacterium]
MSRRQTLFRRLLAALVAGLMVLLPVQAFAFSRIKDLVDVEGVRDNMLVGYGLVVGLNNTGDSTQNAPFTQQSLQTMLERLGVNVRGTTMQTKNVAAVMVTANLPAFSGQGTRIDVSVSAMGDSKSLQGGTLVVTPLYGADGNIYALAQGPVTIGGFQAQGQAASVTRGVPTAGRIANGAIVERQTGFKLSSEHVLKLSLHNPDLTTAMRIADAINRFLGTSIADASDPANVKLSVPANYPNGVVGMLNDIDQLRINPDQSAKVVIDEQSGVIVMGADVRVSTVAIAQGNLTIRVTETPQVSQPAPFSQTGTTTTVPRTQIQIDDSHGNKMAVLSQGVSLQKLVDGLNALGVGPRDIISILQAIKAAGALQADIEVIG